MKLLVPLVLILIVRPLGLMSQNTIPAKINTKKKVGAIVFNPELDDPSFPLCDENNIMEYYQVKPRYKEGLKSIRQYFSQVGLDSLALGLKDGFITVRFVVNCEGQTDRYRVYAVDENYQTQLVPFENQDRLKRWLRKMGGWTAGQYEGIEYDSYKFLTFKIKNNKKTEIMT